MSSHAMSTAEQRFWPKVEKSDGCWIWLASKDRCGYGRFNVTWHPTMRAHRFAYELLVGPVPYGMQLDHLCRNPSCVNPAHLEPVTSRENTLRGEGRAARQARQTHCKRGHQFTPENTYVCPKGHRYCRHCKRVTHREYMRVWRAEV